MIQTKLTVGGTQYSDYRVCKLSRSMSENNATSNISVILDTPFGRHSDDFTVGQEIVFYADKDTAPVTVIFTGILEEIRFNGAGTNQTLELRGRDYSARLMDVKVEPIVYSNSEISTIVTDIINREVQDVTTTNVDVTLTTLKRIAFNHTPVYDALSQLAKLAGYIFYVDENKDLHFEAKSLTSSGYTLDNTNLLNLRYDQTREGMANRIWVYGDRQLVGRKEILSAGSPVGGSVFTLNYKPHDTEIMTSRKAGSVLKGGVFEMVGVATSGQDYLVSFEDKQLIFVSGTSLGYSSIPNSGGSVVAAYNRDIPIVKFGQNRASITAFGPKEEVILDKSIKDPNTARDILFKALDESDPFKRFDAEVKGWFNLTPGQTIIVNLDNFGVTNEVVPILAIDYKFDENTVQNEKIISISLDKRILDITDQIKNLRDRLNAIESQDLQESDLITRLETSIGSMSVVGSYWETKGRRIHDSFIAGHPNNGIIGILRTDMIGSITNPNWATGSGDLGNCLDFSGTSYMAVGNHADLMPITGLTLSMWFNLTTTQTQDSFARVMNKEGGTPRNGYTWIWVSGTTPVIRLEIWNAGVNTGTGNFTPGGGWESGVWYHMAATYASGGTFNGKQYFNGSLVTSGTIPINIGSNTMQFAIATSAGAQGTSLFNAKMDDVRVYNRALSAEEVGSIYRYSNVSGGLKAHYRMNEGLGSVTYNSVSGNNYVQPLLGDYRGTAYTLYSGGYF